MLESVCVCMCVRVCGHPKRHREATMLRGCKMCVHMSMLMCVCLCVAEVLIFFVSAAQMQDPSSSTSMDSAVCIELWEAGVGCKWVFFWGGWVGWMPLVAPLKWGPLTERARGRTHSSANHYATEPSVICK